MLWLEKSNQLFGEGLSAAPSCSPKHQGLVCVVLKVRSCHAAAALSRNRSGEGEPTWSEDGPAALGGPRRAVRLSARLGSARLRHRARLLHLDVCARAIGALIKGETGPHVPPFARPTSVSHPALHPRRPVARGQRGRARTPESAPAHPSTVAPAHIHIQTLNESVTFQLR